MNQPNNAPARNTRLRRAVEITAAIAIPLVALVVAFLAWRYPVAPSGGPSNSSSQQNSPTAGPTGGSASSKQASTLRPLKDLPVNSGAGNVRADGDTLSMECGSGESDDRYREVEYLLRGAYTTFTATVATTKVTAPEVRTQLEVFVDSVVATNTVLTGTESTEVTAETGGGATLRLRLTCQQRDTVLVLSAATVRA